jgi:hypothetical protein
MSGGKTDVLNRTWTLIPENVDEDGGDDMIVEDIEMMTESVANPIKGTTVNNRTFTNNELYTTANISNSASTPATPSPLHHPLNTTYNNRAEPVVSKYSPGRSPYYLIKCLNIDFEKVSIEMDNYKTRFESICVESYDSLFDENCLHLL